LITVVQHFVSSFQDAATTEHLCRLILLLAETDAVLTLKESVRLIASEQAMTVLQLT
jgi:hypothetical protein